MQVDCASFPFCLALLAVYGVPFGTTNQRDAHVMLTDTFTSNFSHVTLAKTSSKQITATASLTLRLKLFAQVLTR